MSDITLNPISKEDIHKLETALLIGTLFRNDVLELLNSEERITWLDSLAVAAAAIAREAAKMSIDKISEELGRSESTIRLHIQGKSKAGQLVKETYQRFIKEGVKINVPTAQTVQQDYEELKKRLDDTLKRNAMLEDLLKKLINDLTSTIERLKTSLQL